MKISIITPCYNSSRTIERTINSVINQKGNFELEYIIVDGKSNDDTLDIIKRYAKENKFIKYISEKDNSMTEALNKGLKMVSGDLVGFINADDEYIENSFQNIVDKFLHENIKIVTANTYFIYDGINKIKCKNLPKYFSPMLTNVIDCPFPECSVFFRKECFDKVGFFNERLKYTQDYELYLRMYYAGYKFSYLNKNVSKFYISDTQYSSIVSDKMREEVLSFVKYKTLFQIFAHSNFSKIVRFILGMRIHRIVFLGKEFLLRNDKLNEN